MEPHLYLSFENEMRGSREVIFDRLSVYLPIIAPLLTARGTEARALDVGCGRGEWLELLKEDGWVARGIDSNSAMVESCDALGLDVIEVDGEAFLKSQPDQSYDVISAFHVVEHLPFEALATFLKEAHRLLRAGGILIMETPNPQNILVGSCEFYVDPTHQRPVPSKLLHFMAKHTGYTAVRTLFLNQAREPLGEVPQLSDVFLSVGFDYCVLAQKQGPDHMMQTCSIERPDCAPWGDVASLGERLYAVDQKLLALHAQVEVLQGKTQGPLKWTYQKVRRLFKLLF